jgi:hypothetical protein
VFCEIHPPEFYEWPALPGEMALSATNIHQKNPCMFFCRTNVSGNVLSEQPKFYRFTQKGMEKAEAHGCPGLLVKSV